MVSLFNGISINRCRLFNTEAIVLEEQSWYYLTHSWEDKEVGVHTFPKGICLKVTVIARLEYELAYYDSAVHHFNHYTMRTPPWLHLMVKNIFWRVETTPSLFLVLGPLYPRLVVSVRVQSTGQINQLKIIYIR